MTVIVSNELQIDDEDYNEILVVHDTNIELSESFKVEIPLSNHLTTNSLPVDSEKSFARTSNSCFNQGNSLVCFFSYIRDLLNVWEYGRNLCASTLNSTSVAELINNNSEQFDLVISDFYAQEVMNMFAHINNAPLVLVSAFDEKFPIYRAMGAYSIWSSIPQLHGPYDRDENFIERLTNRVFTYILTRFRRFFHLHYCNKIVKKYFENFASAPSVRDIERKASLILFNSFDVFGEIVHRQPGVIDIGGIHVFPPKSLTQNIKVISSEYFLIEKSLDE